MFKQIPVGSLSGYDIGRKVMVTMGDTVLCGTLHMVSWINFGDTNGRGVECFGLTVNLEGGSSFELKQIPLSYVIQIEEED